ncbi:hypothetical protein evm_002978 [Chilo suppressalis]|nr:hypothetical protein evm_002978 [Chilo suppressalis]
MLKQFVLTFQGATPTVPVATARGVAANLQAIAFTAPHLRARQPCQRPPHNNELTETGSVPVQSATEPLEADEEAVRRRDSLPMEVT